ncbi:unnamed protein product [Symbiodinium microadriaticum]|nr:unnamed protein product [Symbiodinium microadriaticum]
MALVMNKSKALTTAIVSVVAVSSKYASPLIREEALRAVHTVKRYLCLAHALIYKNANGTSDVSDLIGRGLLTQGEAAILIGADTHAGTLNRSLGRVSPGQAYSWANMTMERIGAAGLLGPALDSSAHHMVSFFSDLSVIQAAACDVSMYVDVQLPYPFVQMTVVLVYAFLAQLMIVTAGLIGYGLETNDSSYVVTGYITSLLLSFVLLGILQMYDMLSNPLGEDPADFPVSTYMHEGEAEVDDLVNGIWSASIAAGAGGIIPDVRIKPADLRSGGSTPLKK